MDGTLKCFDVRKGEITEDKIQQPIQNMAFSFSDTAYALSTAESKIMQISFYFSLAEKISGKKLNQYTGHEVNNFRIDVCFTKHDSYLLSGSVNGKLYIYDLMRKSPLNSIQAHDKPLSALSIHENVGLISGAHDGSLCFWKI